MNVDLDHMDAGELNSLPLAELARMKDSVTERMFWLLRSFQSEMVELHARWNACNVVYQRRSRAGELASFTYRPSAPPVRDHLHASLPPQGGNSVNGPFGTPFGTPSRASRPLSDYEERERR